jgi:chromosome segregation ATPase
MSRSELKAKLEQVESELAKLKSQYNSDRDRLITLQSQVRVIRDHLCAPFQRYEEYSEAIETAIEGIGTSVREIDWQGPSARQPLLDHHVVVRDSRRLERTRPRLAERYQS